MLLLDVLEHVEDDVGLLYAVQAQPHLHADCTYLITVPAHPSLYTEHDRILGHHRRYTKRGLRKLVHDAGLSLVEDGGFFSSLLAPRAWEKAIERGRGKSGRQNTDLSDWQGSKPFTRIVEEVLHADFLLADTCKKVGIQLPGLSLYAICKHIQ